jgi:NADPH:quinone reductase-like Zn-dependent oxidoreductase
MKAVVYRKYGLADVLHLEDVPTPSPRDGEVLIEVHASSVNSFDWGLLRARPMLLRLGGLFKPKYPILGADVAGRVVSIGPAVTRFKVGDDVYGDLTESGWGGFAEYTCAKQDPLALKPPGHDVRAGGGRAPGRVPRPARPAGQDDRRPR